MRFTKPRRYGIEHPRRRDSWAGRPPRRLRPRRTVPLPLGARPGMQRASLRSPLKPRFGVTDNT